MRACRTCKLISDEPTCPNCKGSDLSEDYSGLMIVLDPEGSILAEKLGVKEPGNYALKIR